MADSVAVREMADSVAIFVECLTLSAFVFVLPRTFSREKALKF